MTMKKSLEMILRRRRGTWNTITTLFLSPLFLMISLVSIPTHKAYAFWSQVKDGKDPQHLHITELVRFPNEKLFLNNRDSLCELSDSSADKRKNFITAHGFGFFGMNERGRALNSFNWAIDHYKKYLKTPGEHELILTVQCLGAAYHYFEDVGDFSKGDLKVRELVTKELLLLKGDKRKFYQEVEAKKRTIPLNIDSIVQKLEEINGGIFKKPGRVQPTLNTRPEPINREAFVPNGLVSIVACLEQINVVFLRQVQAGLSDLRRQDGQVGFPPIIHLEEPIRATLQWKENNQAYEFRGANGAHAWVIVKAFNSSGISMTRSDPDGESKGLTADYVGTIIGDGSAKGTVTWRWHWNTNKTEIRKGQWTAVW